MQIKRRYYPLLMLFAVSMACQTLAGGGLPGRQPDADRTMPAATTTAESTAASSAKTPTATATSFPAPGLNPNREEEEKKPFELRLHPEGGLFVGDVVSFEVLAADAENLDEKRMVVVINGAEIGSAPFRPFGIGGRQQATLVWAWDTGNLEPGNYRVTLRVEPGGPEWSEHVSLSGEEALRFPEPEAEWAQARSECCVLNYVTNTPAERDLENILVEMDRQAERAMSATGTQFADSIVVNLLPRVMGHGGFATDEISISYLDRNYANNNLGQVLHHEMIHILDGREGGEFRPTMFIEGLSVYLSRGHFQREPLLSRAAALVPLGRYTPLQELVENFYNNQHETGYLQAGALVQYMAKRWGWERFERFYREMNRAEEESQAEAINAGLKEHFGLSLKELEVAYLGELQTQRLNPDLVDDVALSVKLYDTIRRYQQALDQSAYFLTAWLMDEEDMRERGIVADYLRRPQDPTRLALELLLTEAGDEFSAGRYPEASRLLAAANTALRGIEEKVEMPFGRDEIAQDYLRLSAAAVRRGWLPQRISMAGGEAHMWVSVGGVEVTEVKWVETAGSWQLLEAR